MSWPLVKLKDVAPAKPCKLSGFNADDDIWQITLDHIESHSGRLLEKQVKPLSEAGSSTHAFDERYVLYSKLRPYLNKVLLPDSVGVGTTELVPMLPDPEKLDRKYLAYYLRSQTFLGWVSNQTAGAKMPRVSMKIFWEHEIPLPTLAEQKRIAAILDKADQLRQKRQQAIALADDFLRSIFLDMFGDPVTNPKGWDTKELDTCLSFLTSGSRGWAKYYAEAGSQFIRIQNVGKNKLLLDDMAYVNAPDGAEAKRTRVQYRDVLLSITADLGRSALVTEDIAGGYINQHLALLRVDEEKLNPRFLSAFLSSRGGVQQFELKNKSAVKSGLNFNDIKTVKLILPPIALQDQYEAAYKHIEMFNAQLQRGLQSTSCLFDSLSQKAFAGEL